MNSPAPVITSLETYGAWDEAWYPRGPRLFAKLARDSGWDCRVGFSRGYVPVGKDRHELRDMIGVYVNGYGRRAAAFWERNPDAEFSQKKLDTGNIKPGEIPSGMQWSTSGTRIRMTEAWSWTYANLNDMEAWIKAHGDVSDTWYMIIQAWVQAHAERDQRKANA